MPTALTWAGCACATCGMTADTAIIEAMTTTISTIFRKSAKTPAPRFATPFCHAQVSAALILINTQIDMPSDLALWIPARSGPVG